MESEPQRNSVFNKVSNDILVILLVTALVLGYLLYQKVHTKPQMFLQDQEIENGTSEPVVQYIPVDPSGLPPLSEDEQAVLNPPSTGATEEEFRAHALRVEKMGMASGELGIGAGCRISPIVLKTQLGKEMTFKNYDTVPHTIFFNERLSFAVPANASITVPVGFEKGAGIYGYGCDQNPRAAGMMLVAE